MCFNMKLLVFLCQIVLDIVMEDVVEYFRIEEGKLMFKILCSVLFGDGVFGVVYWVFYNMKLVVVKVCI